jgi:sialidase-1
MVMSRLTPAQFFFLLILPSFCRAAPIFEEVDVFTSGQDGYFAFRIPSIETAPDGSLLAFAEARKHGLHDPGFGKQDIDLVLKRSTDAGRTWSAMKIIEDPGEAWSAANAVTIVDKKHNRVWVVYLQCRPGRNTYSARAGTDDIRILARTSDDHGQTWSDPTDLTSITRDMNDKKWRSSVPGPGGGIQARDGTLAFAAWRFEPWGVFTVSSADAGKTWKRGPIIPDISGDECQLVELADGSWLIDVRQQKGPHRWHATSKDAGQSWSKPTAGQSVSEVACAIERFTLKSAGHDRDRILWTGPKGPERNNLVIRVSYDEAKTFPHEKMIYSGRAAYSDLTILKDQTIGVLWERGEKKDYEFIRFTRFNQEWLEAN